MFAVVVSYHARSEQYLFASVESAYSEMTAIQSRIGKKWYGRNGDEENPTYRFKHELGEAAICLEKVESVVVVDPTKDDAIGEQIYDMKLARFIRHKTKERQAKAEAGLIDLPDAAE